MLRRFAAVVLPLAVLAGLVLVSFAPVLRAPGIVGHVWDWGVPNFAEQFADMAKHHFSTWDAYYETGRYHYFKLELLYWLAITPFSVLGGAAMSKWLPIILTLWAGASMLALARRSGLDPFYAALSTIFYALSPYAFSRTAAGHMPMLAGYALLPLIILSGLVLLDRLDRPARSDRPVRPDRPAVPDPSGERRSGGAYFTVLTGFLLGLCSLHPGVGISAAAMLTILFGVRFLKSRRKMALAASFMALCAVAVLMNIHFMAPFAGDYFGKGAIRHGWGLSVSADGDVTVDTELPRREAYHQSASQPADASTFLRLRPGMDTEYAYPVPEALAPVWNLAALFLSLAVFAYPFSGKRRKDLTGLFAVAIIGVLLVSGSRTVFGYAFYQGALKKVLPILFAAFSNTTRWLPLIILPYAILSFYALQNAAPAKGRRALWLKAASALALGIFIWPYISGALLADYDHDAVPQPLTLKVTPIHPDDAKVYAFLRDQREDSRAVYLPAIGITWPGETEHSFEWSSAYSPKPFFLASAANPLGQGILDRMYSEYPSRRLGRLFGLASARYLVYPRYEHAYTYVDYQPGYKAPAMVDGYKDYKPVLDATLAMQRDMDRLPLFSDVEILRNEDFLPLVRAADRAAAVEKAAGPGGNVVAAVLPELVELPDYDPGAVYVRAGRDPEFLRFLDGMMGPGKRETRVLFDREEKRETVIMTPKDKLAVPSLEFRRLGPTRLRVRVHGAKTGFPLVFQETYHPGWKAAFVPIAAPAGPGRDEERRALLALAKKAEAFPGNERDQAVGGELSDLVRQGRVTALGDGADKTRKTYAYGQGGRVIAADEQAYAVDFVAKPVAGAVQNDNLPDAPLFATLQTGGLAMARESAVNARGATTPEIPDPLDPEVWSPTGADGTRPVAWPDLFHLEVNGFANGWWMDPAIAARLPEAAPDKPGYFVRNPDGSMDFELFLDFAPQKFYLIGLMASASVMGACVTYLIVFGLFGFLPRGRRQGERAHG